MAVNSDTWILDQLLKRIRSYLDAERPASVAVLEIWEDLINEERGGRRTSSPEPKKCPHGVSISPATVCLQCADPVFHVASRNNPTPYQTFTLTGMPQAGIKEVRDKYQVNGYPYDEQPFQNFWRCEHHPSALDNYFARRECTMGCNMNELRWFDNGTCKPQIS
jgi:hypothetical protein